MRTLPLAAAAALLVGSPALTPAFAAEPACVGGDTPASAHCPAGSSEDPLASLAPEDSDLREAKEAAAEGEAPDIASAFPRRAPERLDGEPAAPETERERPVIIGTILFNGNRIPGVSPPQNGAPSPAPAPQQQPPSPQPSPGSQWTFPSFPETPMPQVPSTTWQWGGSMQ